MGLDDADQVENPGAPAGDASPTAASDASPTALADATPPTRPPKRPRKGVTPDEARRRAEAMWLGRKTDALKKAKTPEDKRRILEEINARAGLAPLPAAAPPPAPTAPAPASAPAAASPGTSTPPPPAPPAGRPGWPTDAEIDAITPEVSQLWMLIGAALKRFVPELDIFAPRADLVMGEDGKPRVVQTSGHQMLVKGTAPCAAKYAPTWASTPEAVAIVSIVAVFGAPLIAMALGGGGRAPAGAAPAPPPATEGAAA